MNKKDFQFILLLLVLQILFTFLSICKIFLQEYNTFSIIFSISSYFCGIILLIKVILIIYSNSAVSFKSYGLGFYIYEDFKENVPDAKLLLDNLISQVSNNAIDIRNNNFQTKLNEVKSELKPFISEYVKIRFNSFLKTTMTGIFIVILIFCFFYISNYPFEISVNKCNNPGFYNTSIGSSNFINCIVEGLYYSVTTFTTLGYGDLRPDLSYFARFLSISEVLLFVLFFGFFINSNISYFSTSRFINDDDIIENVKDELYSVSGGYTINDFIE